MKKLMIYDASCPMCRVYTKGMVAADRTGCLNRMSNEQLTDKAMLNRIDRQRARHEIPMIDLDGGETLYGVDTWLYAFTEGRQSLKRLFSFQWVRVVLQNVYAFISYNRRIIITSAPGRWQLLDLQPDFRLSYRLAFCLLLLGNITALFYTISGTLVPITALITVQLVAAVSYVRLNKPAYLLETMLDYGGHLGMSLLIGGLFIKTGQLVNWPVLSSVGYALLIGQHFLRTYRLGLSPWVGIAFTALVLLLLRP